MRNVDGWTYETFRARSIRSPFDSSVIGALLIDDKNNVIAFCNHDGWHFLRVLPYEYYENCRLMDDAVIARQALQKYTEEGEKSHGGESIKENG